MKEIDILKDMLQYRILNQSFYNRNILETKNPEVRQLFAQLRDDETRAVVKLQQKVERYEAAPGIIARIFPAKPRY